MSTRPRPHDHPAALSLTAFRDSIDLQGYLYTAPSPLFTPDNHSSPAQARILRAIEKDLSRRGSSYNPSFSPDNVLRGVRTQKGKMSRREFFNIVAAEVAKADLPLVKRWYAVASAASHGAFSPLMIDLPSEPDSDREIKRVSSILSSHLGRGSRQEKTVLTALGMGQKHKVMDQYLSGREDRLSIYMDLAHTMARTLVVYPQIKDKDQYEANMLPALRFYCSQFNKKEDYLQTPNIDFFQKLIQGEKLPDGRYMGQVYSEDQVKEVLGQIGQEARIVDLLFTTVDPENIKLSKNFLSKFDFVYQLFPNIRQAMPAIGALWAQSRLSKQVQDKVKESSVTRPSM